MYAQIGPGPAHREGYERGNSCSVLGAAMTALWYAGLLVLFACVATGWAIVRFCP
jgi:hypothetical protein